MINEIQVVSLLAQKRAQVSLLPPFVKSILDDELQYLFGRWFGQIVIRTFGQAFQDVLLAVVAGQHDHRQFPEACIRLDPLQQGNAVQSRHMFVQQQQIEAGGRLVHFFPRRQSVLGGFNTIAALLKDLLGQRADKFVIIDEKQCGGHF